MNEEGTYLRLKCVSVYWKFMKMGSSSILNFLIGVTSAWEIYFSRRFFFIARNHTVYPTLQIPDG